jgi:hypothetical protein
MNIIHPLIREAHDINSEEGINLLKKYVNTLMTGGSKRTSSKPGGKPQGRGGTGKTHGKNTQSRYIPNTYNSKSSLKTAKVIKQHNKSEHLRKLRLKKTLIDKELNELSDTYPVFGQLIHNFDIIVNQAIYNPSVIKELKTMKEDPEYFNQIDKYLKLSSYGAVGEVGQSKFAINELLNLKKHSWWAKILFALLFLSVFRANYTFFGFHSTELVESNKFLAFGSDAYNFYRDVWKQREEADVRLMASRSDLVYTRSGQMSVARGYGPLAKTIQPYLKKIIPKII